jgi:hypothetical protein
VILNWDRIISWFRSRTALNQADKDNLAFTIQEKLKAGDFKTIQGVFNKRTVDIKDAVVYEHKGMDAQLAQAHTNHQLAIYE